VSDAPDVTQVAQATVGLPAVPSGFVTVTGEVAATLLFVVVFSAVLTTIPFPPGSVR
jgi:hypothetical protein